MDIESKTRIFCNAWQSISVIYEDYARKSGISYNSLYIPVSYTHLRAHET